MSADDTKISAASAFDSLKNYNNPSSSSAVFSGSIAASTELIKTITFSLTRAEGSIGSFLFNYSGSPNDSTRWLFGSGPLRWGLATLDGGWGDVPIQIFSKISSTQAQFNLSLANNDIVPHNIVSAVTATIRPALFITPF